MILVDTSVWVDHFRAANRQLLDLLTGELVLMHPFVIGELACGDLRPRIVVLSELKALPSAVEAEHHEVAQFVEDQELWGKGLGWIDAHLLASAVLSQSQLWTLDKALLRAATPLRVNYP